MEQETGPPADQAIGRSGKSLQAEADRIRRTRRAIVFGVVMATVQMSIILYFMYC